MKARGAYESNKGMVVLITINRRDNPKVLDNLVLFKLLLGQRCLDAMEIAGVNIGQNIGQNGQSKTAKTQAPKEVGCSNSVI